MGKTISDNTGAMSISVLSGDCPSRNAGDCYGKSV